LSLSFVLIYFYWYPRKVAKKIPDLNEVESDDSVFKNESIFNPNEILSRAELMKHSFRVFLKNFKYFGGLIFILSAFIAIIISSDSLNLFYENDTQSFALIDFFNYTNYPLFAVISLVVFVYIQFKGLLFLRLYLNKEAVFSKQNILYTVLAFTSVFVGFIAVVEDGYQVFAFVLFPIFSLISSIVINQNVSLFKGINLMGSLLYNQWSSFIIGAIFSFTISWVLFIILSFGMKYLFLENSLLWILTNDESALAKIKIGITTFQISVGFLFYMIFNSIFNSLLFYTLKEINTAQNLISRIHQIKSTK
jgi:hypothetical protein